MVDLARGGLYTHEEVSAWEDLLAFPTYHTALLRSLSLGTCISKQLCTQVADQPGYDLNNIMDEQLSWRNPWEKLQRELEKWGGRCSIMMLAYLIIRTLVDIILVALTAIREGPAAVLALIVELYASSTVTYQRIRRRHQRARQRRKRASVFSSEEGLRLTSVQTRSE